MQESARTTAHLRHRGKLTTRPVVFLYAFVPIARCLEFEGNCGFDICIEE
jgi:hypothetical protein